MDEGAVILLPGEGEGRVALLPVARPLCAKVSAETDRVTVPGACEESLRAASVWMEHRGANRYVDPATGDAVGLDQQAVRMLPQRRLRQQLDQCDSEFLYGECGLMERPTMAGLFGVLRTADALGCRWLTDLCCLAVADHIRHSTAHGGLAAAVGGCPDPEELAQAHQQHPFVAALKFEAAAARNAGMLSRGTAAAASAVATSEYVVRVGTPSRPA
eukprot:TRINITY_DN47630_c0_g1_i1.p1 TRINITY_DN47630_c0_g1~~TRINITY_DN47630_c0_g1_i1.p1  ORF type:complete len:216 (+),score=65.03 TRINITY_DN47630_c0_g1_i1:52-699(+)